MQPKMGVSLMNFVKLTGLCRGIAIIALAAVIGFSFVSCGGDGDDTIPAKWRGIYQGDAIDEYYGGGLFDDCTAEVIIYNDDDYGGMFSYEFFNSPYSLGKGYGLASVKSGGTIAGSLSGEYVYIFNDVRRLGILVNIPSERKVYAFFGAKVSEIILEYEQDGVTATPAISASIDTSIIYSFNGYKQY
jgi:hypothetical protein